MTQPSVGMGTDFTTPFNRAFDDVSAGVKVIVDKFNAIVHTVNEWRWMLGFAAMWWIRDKLDDVERLIKTVLDKVDHAIDHQLPVLSLISTSFRWIEQVKTPVSDLSLKVVQPASLELANWTGPAASTYTTMAGQQKAAVDDTVTKAEFISTWLFKIAKANVDFAVQLAKTVTAVAGKLTQAAVDATTVIDIPWAIDKLSDSVGKIVEDGLNDMVSIASRFVDAVGNVRDIAGQVGDHSKLPGGRWPEAVRG
jgi:hypothetical protein